jgi:8-oxo-dGTP diphosphatase
VTRLSVALLLEYEGKIVLQLRDDDPSIYFPGYWSLFTGGIEECDMVCDSYSLPKCVVLREISEELGVKRGGVVTDFVPDGLKLFHIGIYEDKTQKCKQHVFSSKLHVPFEYLVLREGTAIGLFGRDEISDMKIAANYKEIIKSYFDKQAEEPETEQLEEPVIQVEN